LTIAAACNAFTQAADDPDNYPEPTAEELAEALVSRGRGKEVESEVKYPCFCEALAACSSYYNPNPFLPLSEKLTQFLSTIIIPRAKRTAPGGQRQRAALSRVRLGAAAISAFKRRGGVSGAADSGGSTPKLLDVSSPVPVVNSGAATPATPASTRSAATPKPSETKPKSSLEARAAARRIVPIDVSSPAAQLLGGGMFVGSASSGSAESVKSTGGLQKRAANAGVGGDGPRTTTAASARTKEISLVSVKREAPAAPQTTTAAAAVKRGDPLALAGWATTPK